MNAKQTAKQAMYLVLTEYLNDTNASILAQMPSFVTYFTEFKLLTEQINSYTGKQDRRITGYAMEKKQAREKMENTLLNITSRVRGYAINIDDMVLYEEVNLKRGAMERLSDAKLRGYVTNILPLITAILPDLVDYDVTAAMLTTLEDELDAYVALIPRPRHEIKSRVLETRKLAEFFGNADVLLNKMTELVMMLEFSEPDFYSNFFDQRKIDDHGSRRISFLGTIFGEGSQLLEKVLVSIPSLKRSTYSTELGNFEFKHLPEGDHFVTFSRPGYFEHQAVVSITSTLQTKLDVVLKESALKVA